MPESRILETSNTDPTINLAMEEALLLGENEGPSLFLWQNAHTVVIGRGQNAWKECRVTMLREEGGTLVRRSTGGGAVYHDLGNLNFSFLMPKALYDVPRQLDVIRAAVRAFGVETERSGRNDIVLKDSGAKFSGNAFRHTQTASLHHGTILMDVDMALLGRYLAPSQAKLAAKGVQSVRARVGNLRELAPSVTIQGLKDALFDAFRKEYGPAQLTGLGEAAGEGAIRELTEKYRSWEWTYGATPRFDATLETRFAWGGVELLLSLAQGRVTQAQCFTDANDPDLGERVAAALAGAAFTPEGLAERLLGHPAQEDRDVGEWLREQSL
ncbi:MAG TPA: lipoate--protein ligase [Candidatus Limnocylindria bacterium]|nr:lipoate--protein ligase [Candidatus Limnocylindria bacterium]